jgi:type II secretion system protein H
VGALVASQSDKLPASRAFSGKSASKRPSLLGFTLVEIMVVVVIVGIALSVAVSNLFVSREERVRQETSRLMVMIERTRDQAAFTGYPIAMRLTGEGVEFLERDPNSIEAKWRSADDKRMPNQLWRDGVKAELTVSQAAAANNRTNSDADQKKSSAQLVTFLPTGIGAPFSVRVFDADFQRVIDGDALGNVSIRQ